MQTTAYDFLRELTLENNTVLSRDQVCETESIGRHTYEPFWRVLEPGNVWPKLSKNTVGMQKENGVRVAKMCVRPRTLDIESKVLHDRTRVAREHAHSKPAAG